MRKRKQFTMILTVSVPLDMTAAQARREVRTLVSEQCNYSAECEDIKAIGCRPYSNAHVIRQLGESTKMLRQLRQYASYIRNQVMMQHMGGKKAKPKFTYIDLDTLDEVSVICMMNCEQMEKLGADKRVLQKYLRNKRAEQAA